MKRIITYGTFDLIHPGHINILKKAKELGDELYVGLSTDKFCETKGKTPVLSYEQRKIVLESIKYVDYVFPEKSLTEEKIKDGLEYDAYMFVWGSDWEVTFDFLKEHGFEVKYFPRTPDISTSILKDRMKNNI